ncbi:hypothetical protein Daus18300_012595 [Diaporthe australafricana]|uniref:Uncharacterized protein n=1 Tax=Diaporthe australafricana TaxID=127596 RepID=A0ABR3W2V0_9PEZI
MQSHSPPVGPPPPATSFLSLPYELRHQIYRLILRSLPRVKPMRGSSPPIHIYCLQNLDPQPLFVHPQVKHEIEALLASHTRIQIPALLDHNDRSTLSAPTQQWLQQSSIEFNCIRVWSELRVPITLDVNVFAGADGLPAVHYRWRWRPCRWRLYSWGLAILGPALPVMIAYLSEGLRNHVAARSGADIGVGELDFLMESMGRFRSWFDVHHRLRSRDSRLSAESYEEKVADLPPYIGDEQRDDFRRRLEWWDGVEAEVRGLKND